MPDNSSSTVVPHNMQIVIWDRPAAMECGKPFSIMLGAKCSSECRPDGWEFVLQDHSGTELTRAQPGDDPWPGTSALYFASVELTAPAEAGMYAWRVGLAAPHGDLPHNACRAAFNVNAVPQPDCLLTVEAVDSVSQAPVAGVRVVAHPYRGVTDEQGLARVRVPKGEYRVFVSGKNYFPFQLRSAVNADLTIRAELHVDRELSDADIWG